jgi:hypothetical protein
MHDVIQNPLFQSVILPFIVALIVAELFQRLRLSGLAVIAAFCATLFFTYDFVFWPLTAIRKLELAALISAALALVMDYALKRSRWVYLLPPLIAGLATWWVLSSAFAQLAPLHKWQYAGGVILFVVWLAAAGDGLRDDSVKAGATGWGLGLGAGLAAWLAASSLLGMFAVSVGCASAAYLFIQIFSDQRLPTGRVYVLPASLITGLAAAASVMLGKLPWIVLPILATVPLLVRLTVSKNMTVRGQALVAAALASIPAAVSIFIIWRGIDIPALG